jgi:hypothetical protein
MPIKPKVTTATALLRAFAAADFAKKCNDANFEGMLF